MTYPNGIEKFSDKLNRKQDGSTYVVEEEITITEGVFEGYLKHDNVIVESVAIYTEPGFGGERVENYFLSTPSETPWSKILKVFSDVPKVYVVYETTGDQVEAEDINVLQDAVTATQTEVERYKNTNDQFVNDLDIRLTDAESNKADKTYVDTELLAKADKVNTYTKTETDQRIQAVIGAAPEALDTLVEIADALNNDPDFAGTITNELSKKVTKVEGKQLSTEDYTTTEKTKLAGVETGANKYVHPTTHFADMVTETSAKQFTSDAEKTAWNAKETPSGAQAKANTAEANAKAYADSITPTKVSQLENDSEFITQDDLGESGFGDMQKAVYDKDNDGVIDVAKTVAGPVMWNELKGV